MGVVKKYVHNRHRPEGCIAEGWGTEEVIEFCIDYMDLNPIGVPVSRHEGRLQGKGILGKKALRINDRASFTQAHFAVLQQSVVAGPYVDMHKRDLRRNYPLKSEVWIAREHRDKFGG